MGKFFTALKRGFEAMGEVPAGDRYTVAGKAVACLHCSHDRFVEGHAQLNIRRHFFGSSVHRASRFPAHRDRILSLRELPACVA